MRSNFWLHMIGILLISSTLLSIARVGNSAPSISDITAPKISAISIPGKVFAGSNFKIEITVTDDQGVKTVALFYREKGKDKYTKLEMNRATESNEYYAVINNAPKAGLEYYVEAVDVAGNMIRKGLSYSPHSIAVLANLNSTIKNLKEGRLNNKEILALFKNNTVEGHHIHKHFSFTRYFGNDNRLVGINSRFGKRVGRWRVKGNQLCEQFSGPKEQCREIVKEGESITKYTTNRKGDRVIAIVYKRFRYGNPEGLK